MKLGLLLFSALCSVSLIYGQVVDGSFWWENNNNNNSTGSEPKENSGHILTTTGATTVTSTTITHATIEGEVWCTCVTWYLCENNTIITDGAGLLDIRSTAVVNVEMQEATYVEGFHDKEAVQLMTYTDLGNTGLRLSRMGFGGSPAGGVFGDLKEEETEKILTIALKSGCNYIDTSPWYGNGRSEEVLGKALKSIPRKAYYIGTKVGRYEPNVEKMFDFSAERIAKSVDLSLKKLGLDYVDIIQVHDLEFAPNLDIIINETLPALQKVIDQGKARFIGITCYPVSVLKEVIERSKVKINCVLSYARLTLLNDDLKQYMDFFKSHGVGVINAASVAMGLLAQSPYLPVWHPAPDNIRAKVQQARDVCTKADVDLGRLAVHYSLETPGIATHLMGNSSLSILILNISSVTTSLTDTEKKTTKEIKTILSEIGKTHWEGDDVAKYWSQLKVARGEVPQDPSVKPFL